MRDVTYVPDRIADENTELAVYTLARSLDACGACTFELAYERICRLLGWMCERGMSDDGH